MLAASRPLPVIEPVRSGEPGNTCRRPAREVTPSVTDTGVWRSSSIERHRPDASDELLQCRRTVTARPAASWLAAFEPSATSCTVRPAASSRAGSVTTSISRVSLDSTATLPAPATRASARPHHVEGVIVQIRARHRAGQIEDVEWETPPASGARRQVGPAGSVCRASVDLALDLLERDDHVGRRLELGGDFGGPAEVVERTRRMPGTSITACSSGRVTVSIIVCAGSVPL